MSLLFLPLNPLDHHDTDPPPTHPPKPEVADPPQKPANSDPVQNHHFPGVLPPATPPHPAPAPVPNSSIPTQDKPEKSKPKQVEDSSAPKKDEKKDPQPKYTSNDGGVKGESNGGAKENNKGEGNNSGEKNSGVTGDSGEGGQTVLRDPLQASSYTPAPTFPKHTEKSTPIVSDINPASVPITTTVGSQYPVATHNCNQNTNDSSTNCLGGTKSCDPQNDSCMTKLMSGEQCISNTQCLSGFCDIRGVCAEYSQQGSGAGTTSAATAGMIAGVVFGVLLIVGLLVFALVQGLRRKNSQKDEKMRSDSAITNPTNPGLNGKETLAVPGQAIDRTSYISNVRSSQTSEGFSSAMKRLSWVLPWNNGVNIDPAYPPNKREPIYGILTRYFYKIRNSGRWSYGSRLPSRGLSVDMFNGIVIEEEEAEKNRDVNRTAPTVSVATDEGEKRYTNELDYRVSRGYASTQYTSQSLDAASIDDERTRSHFRFSSAPVQTLSRGYDGIEGEYSADNIHRSSLVRDDPYVSRYSSDLPNPFVRMLREQASPNQKDYSGNSNVPSMVYGIPQQRLENQLNSLNPFASRLSVQSEGGKPMAADGAEESPSWGSEEGASFITVSSDLDPVAQAS
ncbi:uncharacterized protein VTP21DRAFT_8592 [Calcarisporiella thermophila]|uniref:uncharacterized protein n=1 Tax=Calcarisporiella thermophila TaxID=911321 RepID=UPI003743C8A2